MENSSKHQSCYGLHDEFNWNLKMFSIPFKMEKSFHSTGFYYNIHNPCELPVISCVDVNTVNDRGADCKCCAQIPVRPLQSKEGEQLFTPSHYIKRQRQTLERWGSMRRVDKESWTCALNMQRESQTGDSSVCVCVWYASGVCVWWGRRLGNTPWLYSYSKKFKIFIGITGCPYFMFHAHPPRTSFSHALTKAAHIIYWCTTAL